MKDWREEYQRKLVSAEEVAKLVKPGDTISFTLGREAYSVGLAIAARAGELRDVKIFQPFPGYDFGWYDPGWEEFFQITIYMPTAISQQMVNERRCDIEINDRGELRLGAEGGRGSGRGCSAQRRGVGHPACARPSRGVHRKIKASQIAMIAYGTVTLDTTIWAKYNISGSLDLVFRGVR